MDATRKLGQSAPDFVEEFVFDGTYPGLLADAVRRLFTESKVQNPASEVTSTNQDGKPQSSTLSKEAGKLIQLADWRREVVEFTVLDAGKFDDPQQGSSINTDVTTDTGSPEAAVDTDDSNSESQSKSVDSPLQLEILIQILTSSDSVLFSYSSILVLYYSDWSFGYSDSVINMYMFQPSRA